MVRISIDRRNDIDFECPWCGKPQTKSVARGAEVEVKCSECKKSIGIATNEFGEPIRIGQLTSVTRLLELQEPTQRTYTRSDMHPNTPSINIGSVQGNISFGGDVNVTNIYNETIKIIDAAKDVSNEQKSQAKKVLDYVKDNASPFLPIIAEAIKKALGLG